MTKQTPQTTPAFNPWDVPSLYAASFGLFAPGALMAARLRAAEDNRLCQPSPRA